MICSGKGVPYGSEADFTCTKGCMNGQNRRAPSIPSGAEIPSGRSLLHTMDPNACEDRYLGRQYQCREVPQNPRNPSQIQMDSRGVPGTTRCPAADQGLELQREPSATTYHQPGRQRQEQQSATDSTGRAG